MTNREKIAQLASKEKNNTLDKIRFRNANRQAVDLSKKISLRVLLKLDEIGWSQKRLAKEMGVTPQQVSKIVNGSSNYKLETLMKLEEALDLGLFKIFLKEFIISLSKAYSSQSYVPPTSTLFDEDNIAAYSTEVVANKYTYEYNASETNFVSLNTAA